MSHDDITEATINCDYEHINVLALNPKTMNVESIVKLTIDYFNSLITDKLLASVDGKDFIPSKEEGSKIREYEELLFLAINNYYHLIVIKTKVEKSSEELKEIVENLTEEEIEIARIFDGNKFRTITGENS